MQRLSFGLYAHLVLQLDRLAHGANAGYKGVRSKTVWPLPTVRKLATVRRMLKYKLGGPCLRVRPAIAANGVREPANQFDGQRQPA